MFVQFLIFMIKITVNKFFKQKNVCRQFDFHDIRLLSEQQMTIQRKKYHTKNGYKKKRWTAMDCFFFIEFFLYLQYLLIRCTNSFYQVLTTLFKMIKNKLLFFTIMQLKTEHGYFQSFQYKLSNWTWNFRVENDLCSECHVKEKSSHLILKCKKFEKEIDVRKSKFSHIINFQYFFTISGQPLLIRYLQKTHLATRKWFLHLDQEIYEGGWGDLRPDSPDSATSAEKETSDENLD